MVGNLKFRFLSLVVGIFIGIFIGILLGIIGITFFKGLTSPLSVEQLSMLSTTIMAMATVFLVAITACYASSTHKILDDQRKSRQLADIDKKLEMFYQPLENLFKISTDRNFVKVSGRGVHLEPNAKASFEKINAYSYLYLACDGVKEFLQIIMTGLLPEEMDAEDFYQMYDHIEDIVTNEISELKNERTKLIG